MSSWQDGPRSPVVISAPAPSPAGVPDEPASLCNTCRSAHSYALRDTTIAWEFLVDHVQLRGTFTQPLPPDVWPDLPRLLESAQAGCGFCAFLREAILSDRFNDAVEHLSEGRITKADRRQIDLEFWYERERAPFSLLNPHAHGLRYMTVKGTLGAGLSVSMHFEIESISPASRHLEPRATDNLAEIGPIDSKNQDVVRWLGLWPPALQNYAHETVTSFLREQLEKCPLYLENDDESNVAFLPERLIEVGSSSLRLVDGDSIRACSASQPQYCALSYCWGPRQDAATQTKSTSESIQRHLGNLDFNALSPVLKDAVKITRSLSIPYLWVDCLCILQDDISDWQRQCSQMNDIYGKARVTLIAASSRSCREGFLNPKRNGLRLPYQSVIRPNISGSFMIHFTHASGEVKTSLNSILIKDLQKDLTLSQWARRGWTFQEDAMAGPRIVFGMSGVYFGRDNRYVAKDGPAGSIQPKSVTSLQTKDELHDAWENVLFRYSAFTPSSFSNPTDILPALSGLARVFGNMLQGRYVAGHWVDRLHLTLLWWDDSRRTRPSLHHITRRHGKKPYLIPTWSCLTRGPVEFMLRNDTRTCRSEITILDVDTSLVGEDPYGGIRNACLTLEGLVLDLASLSWSESRKKLVGSVNDEAGIWFEEKALRPQRPWNASFNIFDLEHTPEEKDAYYSYRMMLDFEVRPHNHPLIGNLRGPLHQVIMQMTMLLVASEEKYEGNILKSREGYGLVLVRLGSPSERSFLRVGTFSPSSYRDTLPCLKGLMRKETIKLF